MENKLHRTRDTLMKEDTATNRNGNAPQALRNTALHLLAHIRNSPTIARKMAQNDKNETLQMIMQFAK